MNVPSHAGGILLAAARDALSIIRHRGRDLLVLLAVAVTIDVASRMLDTQLAAGVGRYFLSVGTKIAYVWLCAPYIVALYRFVLRGENVASERLRNTKPATTAFLWISMLVLLIEVVPTAYDVIASKGGRLVDLSTMLGSLVVHIGVACLAVRLFVGVPAAALDRQLSVQQAFEETRGAFWLSFVTLVIPFLIAGVLNLTAGFVLLSIQSSIIISQFVSAVFAYAIAAVLVFICLCISAQLYRAIDPKRGDRRGVAAG